MQPLGPDPSFQEYLDVVGRLADRELASGYLARATTDEFPVKEFRLLADHGLLGLGVAEEFGGGGVDQASWGLALERVAMADFNLAFLALNAGIAANLLAAGLSATPRSRWLPRVLSGEQVVAFAITEPGSGSDAAGLRAVARPVEGGWRIEGEKTSISIGPFADAAVVFARVEGGTRRHDVTAFLVELGDTVHRQTFADPGFRPVGRGSLSFDGTYVPAEHLLGRLGDGFRTAMREFDLTRPLLGLISVGAARRALEQTIPYVQERTAFGRPIGDNQGVSFPIAEHYTHLATTRLVCLQALALRGAGRPHTIEAAQAKWLGPLTSVEAVRQCILLHGHVGWSEEMHLQQLYRDISGLEIGDGTAQIQKLIIARELFQRHPAGTR